MGKTQGRPPVNDYCGRKAPTVESARAALSQNMTSGAWKCRQRDDGLKIWCAPRENEKPFTDSERAQRWRLSLASLLFLTVLLSDHLWFCAEAKLTRTRDKLASVDMSANHRPDLPSTHSSLRRNEDAIFVVNSTKPLWQLETCHPDGLSENCFTFVDADHLCRGLSETEGTRWINISDLYLSFCNSYSLMDLLYGSLSPDNLNCSLDVIMDGDLNRCSLCVQAYQRYDLHAQEKYEDFEMMADKYETDVYSVRTCMEECKVGLYYLDLSFSLNRVGSSFSVVMVTGDSNAGDVLVAEK